MANLWGLWGSPLGGCMGASRLRRAGGWAGGCQRRAFLFGRGPGLWPRPTEGEKEKDKTRERRRSTRPGGLGGTWPQEGFCPCGAPRFKSTPSLKLGRVAMPWATEPLRNLRKPRAGVKHGPTVGKRVKEGGAGGTIREKTVLTKERAEPIGQKQGKIGHTKKDKKRTRTRCGWAGGRYKSDRSKTLRRATEGSARRLLSLLPDPDRPLWGLTSPWKSPGVKKIEFYIRP